MKKPLVTIFSSCYNHEKFLDDYFESIINQTYEQIELVLIDDCSKDRSCLIIENWLPRLNERFVSVYYLPQEENKGIVHNCNEGLRLANGVYFSPFDSDDVMHPERIEKCVAFLEANPDYALVHSNGYVIGEEFSYSAYSSYHFTKKLRNAKTLPNPEDYFERLLIGNCITSSSVCFKTDIARQLGGYCKDYIHEDYYMWLKFAKNYLIGFLDEPLILYRSHASSFLHTVPLVKQLVHDNERILMEFSAYLSEENLHKAMQKNYYSACLAFFKMNSAEDFLHNYHKLKGKYKSPKIKLLKLLLMYVKHRKRTKS